MHLATINDVSKALNLESLLSKFLLSKLFLFIVAGLKSILEFLVLIHQVLGDTQQLNHTQAVSTFSPAEECCREVASV